MILISELVAEHKFEAVRGSRTQNKYDAKLTTEYMGTMKRMRTMSNNNVSFRSASMTTIHTALLGFLETTGCQSTDTSWEMQ